MRRALSNLEHYLIIIIFAFSFAIGGNGEIFEGRGFNVVGAHAPRYNDKSVGICLIGDWSGSLCVFIRIIFL